MDHPGDIGETLAWTRGQRLFGPLCGGMAEELRHRLALDSGCSPDLLIKFGIKPEASHIRTVSHLSSLVIQIEMADLRSDAGIPVSSYEPSGRARTLSVRSSHLPTLSQLQPRN